MLEKFTPHASPWSRQFDAFGKVGFEYELGLLINLFRINDQDHIYFGAIVKFLSQPLVNNLFREWSVECLFAKRLCEISDFLILNKVNQEFRASNQLKPVKQLLHGRLQEKSLLSIVLERLPLTDREGKDWYLTLSTWLFVRAFRWATDGNYNDEYLSATFSRLRMAADNDDASLSVILELKPATTGLYEIETHLIGSTALQIKRDEHNNAISQFLKALERVAKGEQKPSRESSTTRDFVSAKTREKLNQFIAPESPLVGPSDGNLVESDEGILEATYEAQNPSQTPSQQRLDDYSVLLKSAVDSQYLLFELNSITESELERLNQDIENLLSSSLADARLLALLVWISLHISRSLHQTFQIPVDKSPTSEWTINPDDCNLYRTPPHRASDWKPSDTKHFQWLKPYAQAITIQLPDAIKKEIRSQLSLKANALRIGDFWPDDWMPPENAFRIHFSSYDHLTPGRLDRIFPQYFLSKSADESLAQLISSHPQSGLQASCAYANFTQGEAVSLKNKPFLLSLPGGFSPSCELTAESILLGSALDIVDDVLIKAIVDLNRRYAAYCENANVVDKHNALTTYLILMLNAATGSRPIKDPYESVWHFDFENCILYLDDKAVKGDATGRLVPIPAALSQFIEQSYLNHLQVLGSQLESKNRELSQEIYLMATQSPSGKMPFFFFLEATENELQWTRILPSSIIGAELFDCPLPSNLFRHRYAKRLREEGLNAEIIAGFLGHVDAGCPSYSIYSHRCFLEDIEVARPIIDRIFNDLPFELNVNFHRITPPGIKKSRVVIAKGHSNNHWEVLFGKAAREKAREKRIELWSLAVETDIQSVLNAESKSLTELDEASVEKLTVKMLTADNGLPRHNRAFRYDYLCKRLDRVFSESGRFVNVKKRYVSIRLESVFEEEAAYACSVFKEIRRKIQLSGITRTSSRLNKSSALQLASLLLMFETRLADIEQIKDVFKGNYRILVAEDGHFLEIFNDNANHANSLVRRYRISSLCAYLLDRWAGKSETLIFEQELDPSLAPVFIKQAHVNYSSYESLLEVLSKIVNQANFVELTGIEAGFLSGRLESYGLHLVDWARARYGRLVEFNNDDLSADLLKNEDVDLLATARGIAFLPEKAKEFLGELRRAFFTDAPTHSPFKTRSILVNDLKKIIKQYEVEVSSSLLIFSKWIIKLMESGSKKEHLKLSSILRYFDTLNKPFAELLFNTDLILCDEDEVTEAYTSIIKASTPSNQGYLSNRIVAFHQFATGYYVADPIWSEVPLVKLGVKVSPGYIDEKSYLETLKLLYANARGQADALYQAMLLIFAYRFGLRSKEVFGILRKDLKNDDGLMWVLVRSNYVRALKNRQSARRVPLLFELSPLENTIIKRGLAEAEAEFSDDVDKPLFYYQGKPLDRLQRKHISIQVSQALKLVTGSQDTTLHHCRHSAANRIALAFIQPKLKTWKTADTISGVSNILLGHQMVTKRTSWLTARYLGQGILETQFRSYIHFLPELAECRFRALKKKDEEYILTSKAVIHLSTLKQVSRVDYSLLTLTPHAQIMITPMVIVKIFKLIAIGKSIEWIAEHMDIPTQKVTSIHEVLKKQLSLVTVNNKQVTVTEFFSGFTQTVWDRLTNLVSHFELDASNLDLVCNLKDKCGSPSIMIGGTRQIVLWSSAHFRIFRALNTLFKLTEADYKVLVSVKDNKNIHRYLKLLNLDGKFRESYQLDAILHKGSYIKPRANIVADSISKNAKTSFELVTILLVLLSMIVIID